MRRKGVITIAICFLGIFSLIGAALAEEEQATEMKAEANKIIVIKAQEELRPTTLISSPGITIIWVNHSQTPQTHHGD